MLNERGKAVLMRLIKEEKPVGVAALAAGFKVSNRTLRYDLDNIDNWLKANSLPQLWRKPNCGIAFANEQVMRQRVDELLGRRDVRYYVYSPQERIHMIIIELLQRRDYVTIDNLAQMAGVSRSTVISDLAEVKRWLRRYGLELVPLRRYGIRVTGNENALRRCAVDFLSQRLSLEQALNLMKQCAEQPDGQKTDDGLLGRMDLTFIQETVKKLEAALDAVFTDTAFANLVLHLAFAVRRLQMSREISMPTAELEQLKIYPQFNMARQAAEQLAHHFSVVFPEDEVGYITQHILASSKSVKEREDIPVDLQLSVCRLIEAVGARIGQDLRSDHQLYCGLAAHIGPARERLRQGVKINNPYLEELLAYQRGLYSAVAECAAAQFAQECLAFSADEMGYLTMYFSAALERRQVMRSLPNVLVVCGTGLGTSSLLVTKLKLNFIINIVDTVALHRVRDVLQTGNIDVIVSTVPMTAEGVQVVVVTPFLTPHDRRKLRTLFAERGGAGIDTNRLLQIVEEHCHIRNREGLIADLMRCFDVQSMSDSEAAVKLRLGDVLNPACISLEATARNWEDAVRLGGQLLERNQATTGHYTESMVAALRRLGPYAVIAPGIALPHADCLDSVRRLGISLVRLREPVCFGKPENDPVDLIICFATPDKVSHQTMLFELGKLLSDAEAVRLLRQAQSEEDILAIIKTDEANSLRRDDHEQTIY